MTSVMGSACAPAPASLLRAADAWSAASPRACERDRNDTSASAVPPDVVVSTQGYLNFALLLLRRFVPGVNLVVREVIGERYLENSRFQPLFYRWYLREVRRADRIVVQSDVARDEMIARVRARP